ncbi:MAG: serine/threonine-protein kinase [Planctomycetota bacterium]|nr:serine/threonine-protein kinase [Planctomycetota bacterium]
MSSEAQGAITAGFKGPDSDAADELALIDLLVTDAGRRLRLFSAIGMGIFVAGMLVSLTLPPALGKPPIVGTVMFTLCVSVALLSLAIHLYARRRDARPASLVRVGLCYVAFAAAAMASAETVLLTDRTPSWDGVSGICLWIVLFPLIIPCRPREALVTALASASMLPLSYGMHLALGGDPLPGAVLVRWWGPGYFCAGLSFMAAYSIQRLARDVSRVRSGAQRPARYEVVEKVDEGGMGQVWRARHQFLPHDVAVKLVTPTADTRSRPEEVRALALRFRREARAVAMLRSPNTVRLFDYGVGEHGEMFAVMEYLPGIDLQRLVREYGPQPPGRVIHVLAQACRSLAEAHDKGLLHRDVKPANLMLCRLGHEVDFLKVLDFGLVGAMGHGPNDMPYLEEEGTVSGTLGFIAPEVVRGTRGDARSDLFALGVVGYWLLTGTTLFPGEGGREDLIMHLSATAESPSARLGRPIADDLSQLILSCVDRIPEARPASAAALREALLACEDAGRWTEADAARWWAEREDATAPARGEPGAPSPESAPTRP